MNTQPEPSNALNSEAVYPKYSDQELFVGLVSATGTDLSAFVRLFEERLKFFNYRVSSIRLIETLHEIDRWRELPESPLDVRIEKHMDAGTDFRELLGRGEGLPVLG
ncbi:MAG: hypothetical protein WA823_07995, partial [Candidatus Acidiferrales bacterium]